jgi:hypothetical protein
VQKSGVLGRKEQNRGLAAGHSDSWVCLGGNE